jgi:CRP-like cAMP-binding protein/predicted  nucleic acid-binding Zn-ribbon protein
MSAANKLKDFKVLESLIPLNELDQEKLHELAESSSVMQFTKGNSVSSATEKTQLAFLLSGSVECAPGAAHAEVVKAGTARARHPILSPDKRNRVLAKNDVTVLCVDSELLDFLLNWGQGDGLEVAEIDAGESNDWIDGLMQSETVLSLSPASIQALMSAIAPVEYDANEVIFRQGDAPDYYYIISRGRCVVTHRSTERDAPVELATLEAGDTFGEEALIADVTRNATVRMIEQGLLLRLEKNDFNNLLRKSLINTINAEEAQKLIHKGALRLDIRSANEFARDGEGVNIPFAGLRNRIGELKKEQPYIVVSDDNRMSAVAAFLLSQKQFNVYLLKTATKDEVVARNAEANSRIGELQVDVAQLQRELQEATTVLQKEAKGHLASKTKIRTLEAELKAVQDGAKSAIIEAGSLKNRAETTWRERVSELSEELEESKSGGQEKHAQLSKLKSRLNASIDRAYKAENEQQRLQEQVGELESRLKQAGTEEQTLGQRLAEANEKAEQQQREMNELQAQLQAASDNVEQLGQQLQARQEQYSALESELQKTVEEKGQLTDQLDEAEQQLEKKTAEINDLQGRLAEMKEHEEKTAHELQSTQQQLADAEDSLEASSKVNHLAQQQINQLKQERAEQERAMDALRDEMAAQERLAKQEQGALSEKIETVKTALAENRSRFTEAENDYRERIDKLARELNEANKEIKALSDESSKEKLRNQVLSEELEHLNDANKRSGFMVKFLLVLILLAGIGAGVAYYMGIDLQGQTSVAIEKAAPQIKKLVDSVPLP